ncbi:hypothetical protein HNR19_003945 [Nocardioides thalensis]|uniref:Type IV toxin-antitoxin system AbiEi family antitoxin domain-containing protein n=1 Tax=Nocardioides thalensis TaxID=1914755 RepID=A0A853C7G9_9ACTN|nr:hypothetical protein [Nocardioides thalensis]NYJ03247.1 hypothetical protein [Nocardioides thalensis]
MDPRVVAAFEAKQVLSRYELLDLDVAPTEIRRFLRTGDLERLRRGMYTTREIWQSADEYVGRPRLLARAAIAQMRRGWLLSHDSAAHELGLAILRPKDPLVHVTRPGFTNAWTENGVKHHLARFAEHQVVEVNGMRVLDLARTAVDIARERGRQDGLVACDGAMRMGVTRAELQAAVAPMTHWPGSRAARWAVGQADPGAENPNESLARELVLEAGIGEPETQFPVLTDEGVRWCDIRVGNLVVEAHGAIKYRPPEEGGVALRSAGDVVFEERKRERLLSAAGLVVCNLYWEDYWGERRHSAIRRLRADHAEAVRRSGSELSPELKRQADMLRVQYGDRRPTA